MNSINEMVRGIFRVAMKREKKESGAGLKYIEIFEKRWGASKYKSILDEISDIKKSFIDWLKLGKHFKECEKCSQLMDKKCIIAGLRKNK